MSPPEARLLLIDDDRELCELLVDYLDSSGFKATPAHDGDSGAALALAGGFDAIVLDIMLPGSDGFTVLRRIRAQSAVPVLMLTARGDEVDRIVGLEMGADDYLPKPFNPRELVARLRAILRRAAQRVASVMHAEPPLVAGDVRLEPATRLVTCAGRRVALTGTEFDLLDRLARSAGRVVSRETLSREVLGRELFPEDRSVDVHMSNIRRKLGSHVSGAERIKTVRGAGYQLAILPDADGGLAGPSPTAAGEDERPGAADG